LFPRPIRIGLSLLLMGLCASACRNPTAQQKRLSAAPTEIQRLYQALDSLRQLEDFVKAPAVRALYTHTDAALQDTLLAATLAVLKPILFANAAADTGLIPFYRNQAEAPALTFRNRARAALQLAAFYAHIARDADSTAHYLNRLKPQLDALTDTQQAGWTATLAQEQLLRGALPQAIQSFYGAMTRYEQLGDTITALKVSANLANLYRSMADYRYAAGLHRKAADHLAASGDSTNALIVFQALGADYTDLHQYDSAQQYLSAAEQLLDAGVQNPQVAFYTYVTKGGLYVNLHRNDSARLYFDKARPLLDALPDPDLPFYFTLASIIPYAEIRDVRSQADTVEAALNGFLEAGDLESARKCYFSLWNVAVLQPLPQSALDYHLKYDSLSSILSDTANRRYAARMAAQYETDKKTLTIALQERVLRQRSITIGLLLAILIAASLATAFWISRNRLLSARREARRQQQFTLELLRHTEAERSRIAGHLHDGLSHDLLHLKRSLGEHKDATAQRVDELINDVRAISRAMHPVMLRQIGLVASIQNLCENAMADSDLFVSAELDYAGSLSAEAELQLYRLIQESLTNIVRHGGAVAAKISIESVPSGWQLTIIDNGHGFDVEQVLQSGRAFGLLSIQARSQALGTEAEIQSGPDGTRIRLLIPR
jgi:signal transduction histidine kinase